MYLSITLILLSPLLTASTEFVDTLPSFSDPLGRILQLAVVDPITTDVFAAGANVLYRFSADLELRQRVEIGPLPDHPDCAHPSHPCFRSRINTTNNIAVLEIVDGVQPGSLLLVCGSVYRRICQVRPLDNLTEFHWVHPFNESEGYHSGEVFSRSFIGFGYEGKRTLFTMSSEDPSNRAYSAPFLTAKILEKDPLEDNRYSFRYAFQNDTQRSAVEFMGTSRRVVMDGGYFHGDFIYFLVLKVEGSVLSRVCARDGTLRSYSELPIACNHTTAGLMKGAIAFHLDYLPQIGQPALYVSFTETTDVNKGSALCIYPMSMVISAFAGPKDCLVTVGNNCMEKMKDEITDFCGPDVSPYIARQTLVAPYFNFFRRQTVTAVTTVLQNHEMVAIVGTNNGFLIRISMKTGDMISVNDMLDSMTSGKFMSPFVFDHDKKHIYPLIRNKIIKYPLESCAIHTSCEYCQTNGRKNPVRCGWCDGACRRLDECYLTLGIHPKEFCPPKILEVYPLKGPLQGGIKILIRGQSLGSYVVDQPNIVTVAGVRCEVLVWRNNVVTCTLGRSPEVISGPVKLQASSPKNESIGYGVEGSDTSQLNFTYFMGPRLLGIRPNKGPTSGGTNVTLFGENLDFDEDKIRYFIVRGRLCHLMTFNSTVASCVTDSEKRSDYPDKIGINVDNITYLMEENSLSTFNIPGLSQTFQYIPDPEITQIKPGITTLSGLMNVTVTGRYLDSAASPVMVVHVYVSQVTTLEFTEPCWSDPALLGTRLTCRTPPLSGRPWLMAPPTRAHPLLTHVSLKMDGVRWVRDLPRTHEFVSRLLYYPDPQFKPFTAEMEKIAEDQRTLEVKGNYLDIIHEVNNFQIRIGEKESCKVTSVSAEYLVCDLPSNLKDSSLSKNNLSVEVTMGSIVHQLGYLEIAKVEQNTFTMVISIIVAVFAFVIPCVAIFLCYKKFWRKKPQRHFPLSTRQHNVYNPVPTRSMTSCRESDRRSTAAPTNGHSSPQNSWLSESILKLEEEGRVIHQADMVTGIFLGKGQFGEVRKGVLERSNQRIDVAVKTIHENMWGHPEQIKTFMQEALRMAKFDHERILGLIGVCFENQMPQIVLPYMKNGDMLKYIRDEDRNIKVAKLLEFAIDIVEGMCYLAEERYVHRDLAARNIILDSRERALVADFGMTRDIYEKDYYREELEEKEGEGRLLPYKWTAPEAIERQIFTEKSDVWSYGVVLWELMTRGSVPYEGISNCDLLSCINQGKKLEKPVYCPIPLYEAMRACWNLEPTTRPDFNQLKPFISDIYQRAIQYMRIKAEQVGVSAENIPSSVYENNGIPAKHTVYADSEGLYLSMEGKPLDATITRNYS